VASDGRLFAGLPALLWQSEALIRIREPKLERVPKIDSANLAFFRESGHEWRDRGDIADSG